MQRFLNALKAQSAALDAAVAQPRFATVSSVDPSTYTARVLLQPENVLSGWLPILASWAGAGWGVVSAPQPGQQVLVVAQEGQAEHGVILGAAFAQSTPPPNAPNGELWLVHASGSFLKLRNDGSIAAQATSFSFTGDINLTGSLYATGTVTDATGGDLGVTPGG